MTHNFFKEEYIKIIDSKKTKSLIFAVIFSVLFISSFILFPIFSNYDLRNIMMIFGSVSVAIILLPLIYFWYRFIYFRKLRKEYKKTIDDKGETIIAEIVSRSDKPITLSNSNQYYEFEIKNNEINRVVYLFKDFEFEYEIDKEYRFVISNQCIKEISDEF